jgi:hypothetical protein
MDIVIEVESNTIEERQISSSRGSFTVREQPGWATLPGDRYPQKCTLSLAPGKAAHAPGKYRLAPSSFTIDRYGKLQLKRTLDLDPLTK